MRQRVMQIVANRVFCKVRLITYDDGRCGSVAGTRVRSTRYDERRFFSIALSQVNATQTNAMLAVNLGHIWR